MLVALGSPQWVIQFVDAVLYGGRITGTLVYLALIGVWVLIGIWLELKSR
jgi:hypothetical protein